MTNINLIQNYNIKINFGYVLHTKIYIFDVNAVVFNNELCVKKHRWNSLFYMSNR